VTGTYMMVGLYAVVDYEVLIGKKEGGGVGCFEL
jgi:hypothetical protein